ncbi:hypothetical protein [Rhodohalobacter mucosus]|uniref:Uncharacterized protein n=1 Tax=Rhodohalobacter mucosus TaxID=2079485 RepID=A0A316TRN7_9BACT|nr:hypothetical protein [Rhodohalobacter mucosus]PWN07237.1 hypothetical protein DDZ15_05405 [Rhodohalobacter mucosus]
MWIFILFLAFVMLASAFAGSRNWFTLDRLTRENVLNAALITLLVFTLMMIAYVAGFFPQSIAAPVMMTLYTMISGFFGGYAIRMYRNRSRSGTILYQHRSFWIDHAPNLLSVILLLYGLYRTALLTDQLITGIRVTSGLSLMAIGLFMWTLKAVPEFRSLGILLLDRHIHWKHVIAWHWSSESIVTIEYMAEEQSNDQRIRQFSTAIPDEDRKEIEVVLKSKMEEFSEQRQNVLFPDDPE